MQIFYSFLLVKTHDNSSLKHTITFPIICMNYVFQSHTFFYVNFALVWILPFIRLRFAFFFFFFTRFGKTWLLFMYCSMNSNRKCWLFCRKQCIVYFLWTHKFYFLVTFSLKMSPTILFTHLKIILLQWFQQ